MAKKKKEGRRLLKVIDFYRKQDFSLFLAVPCGFWDLIELAMHRKHPNPLGHQGTLEIGCFNYEFRRQPQDFLLPMHDL